MSTGQAIFLFCAAIAGGLLNSIAGGGGFIALPALLFVGVPPIEANATQTIALWSGVTASGGAYRKRLNVPRRVLVPLLSASVIGGLAGALLLLHTPGPVFLRLLPWLLLGGTMMFVFGNRVRRSALRGAGLTHEISNRAVALTTLFELGAATYGGFFGGGLGVIHLGMLSALGMDDIHAMNAVKSLLGSAINLVAVIAFILAGAILWPQAVVMIAGAVLGGWFGAHYAMKLPQGLVRGMIIAIGGAMTAYFFIKYW